MKIIVDFDSGRAAGIEHQDKASLWPQRAPNARERLESAVRGNKVQGAVHEHEIKIELIVKFSQILPAGFDLHRPFVGKLTAELERQYSPDVEDDNYFRMRRPARATSARRPESRQPQATRIRRRPPSPIRSRKARSSCEKIPSTFRAVGRRSRKADIGPKSMQVATRSTKPTGQCVGRPRATAA